jgi:hypothetical protein
MRLEDMPSWYRTADDAVFGTLAVFGGQFDTARATREAAAAAVEDMGSPEIEGTRFAPKDPLGDVHVRRVCPVHPRRSGRRRGRLRPDGTPVRKAAPPMARSPFVCYGRTIKALVRREAGQYARALELVDEVDRRGHQYGFDEWVMVVASEG